MRHKLTKSDIRFLLPNKMDEKVWGEHNRLYTHGWNRCREDMQRRIAVFLALDKVKGRKGGRDDR
jgi:hypothetical protein